MHAEEETGNTDWLLIPAVLLAWIAIESFINSMIDDFNSVPQDLFALHERAFLQEKRLVLVDKGKNLGEFIIDSRPEYRRLEEKIFFLIKKFAKKPSAYKGSSLWQDFENLKELRNKIAHPRKDYKLSLSGSDVRKHIMTAEEIIKFVAKHVWNKRIEF